MDVRFHIDPETDLPHVYSANQELNSNKKQQTASIANLNSLSI
jgi:hypothetical protein